MLTVCLTIAAYGYDELLFLLFFDKTLGRRYSYKATLGATALCWAVHCLLKVPVLFRAGTSYITLLNLITLAVFFVYQAVMFYGSLVKRALSMALFYVYMILMELISLKLAYLMAGEYKLMQVESNFTIFALLWMFPLLAFGFYPLLCIWDLLQRVKWNRAGRQWLCVFLPLSQYFFLEYFARDYSARQQAVPAISILGMALGILADCYMFLLFYRENQRIEAEKELLEEKRMYERERLYYEHLKESQQETSRIRHDYQNYILMLSSMSKNQASFHQKDTKEREAL